jgi:hypothetical protein
MRRSILQQANYWSQAKNIKKETERGEQKWSGVERRKLILLTLIPIRITAKQSSTIFSESVVGEEACASCDLYCQLSHLRAYSRFVTNFEISFFLHKYFYAGEWNLVRVRVELTQNQKYTLLVYPLETLFKFSRVGIVYFVKNNNFSFG